MMRRYYTDDMMIRHASDRYFSKNRHNWPFLRNKRVLVAGSGGLGNFTVVQLIGAGVGEIHVADPDIIEEHNLNRQFLFRPQDVGRKKIEVLKERLEGVPSQIVGLDRPVEEVDLGRYDLVMDCMDRWENKMELLSRSVERGVPLIFMSVGEGIGLVSVPSRPLNINPRESRSVSPPEIAVTSGFGAAEAIRILEGREPILRDKLLFIDVKNMVLEMFDL